eukprot:TRINITY_DN4718_c0_g1_i7.p1 TRINITY_DN4718_c0_g1~~TRINITY_DN4718_c0_g1_i7.p1  ORF type:complete len:162 (-),score=22.69 TRINITY_DN4718_c0_g1_i7:132-617(-)
MDESRMAKGPASVREMPEKSPLIELSNTICISSHIEPLQLESRRSSDLLIRIPVHRNFRLPLTSPSRSIKNKSCYEKPPNNDELGSGNVVKSKHYNTQWGQTRLKTAAATNKSSKVNTVNAERARFTFRDYKNQYMQVYLKRGIGSKKGRYNINTKPQSFS